MASGNGAATEVMFPKGFRDVVQAEIAAAIKPRHTRCNVLQSCRSSRYLPFANGRLGSISLKNSSPIGVGVDPNLVGVEMFGGDRRRLSTAVHCCSCVCACGICSYGVARAPTVGGGCHEAAIRLRFWAMAASKNSSRAPLRPRNRKRLRFKMRLR
jgi:hypothetical protein